MTERTEFPLSEQMERWDDLHRPADARSYVKGVRALEQELAAARAEIARLTGNWDDAINYAAREKRRADAAEEKLRSIDTGSDGLDDVLAVARIYRALQDEEHGGPRHDDSHTARDWCWFIEKFNMRARLCCAVDPNGGVDRQEYENNLFHVTAIAISAIQSSRRKRAKAVKWGFTTREDGINE